MNERYAWRVGAYLGVIVGVLIVQSCQLEQSQMRFSDYQEAVDAEAMGNRWRPLAMPRSARDIRVVVDLDTGEAWVRYSFGEDLSASSLQGLERATGSDAANLGGFKSLSVSWWPSELRSRATERFVIYRGELRYETAGGQAICHSSRLAVDWNTREAYSYLGPHVSCNDHPAHDDVGSTAESSGE